MTGFDISSVTSQYTQNIDSHMQEISKFSQTMDSSDTGDMLRMQMLMTKFNMAVQLQSAVVKSLEDTLKSIVQRM